MFVWFFIGFIGFVQLGPITDITKLSKEEVGAFIDHHAIPGVAKGNFFSTTSVGTS